MLRIVGGALRGRRIKTPRGRETRPTTEKVREGIFNTIANRISLEGAVVADLYAGAGALGIEALSRGAARATFVEHHKPACAVIRDNLRTLGIADRGHVVTARVAAWLRTVTLQPPPTLILLDPPYADEGGQRTLATLAASPQVPPGTVVVVETAARRPLQPPPGLEQWQAKRYGDTQVLFLVKAGAPAAAAPESPHESTGKPP